MDTVVDHDGSDIPKVDSTPLGNLNLYVPEHLELWQMFYSQTGFVPNSTVAIT